MKVICIANQKGGVAKTATTAIMASALTKRGNKVLAVDMDPQGNLSKQVGAEDNGRGVYSVLRGDIAIQDAIQHFDRFDILPTNILLAGLEGEYRGNGYKHPHKSLATGPVRWILHAHRFEHVIDDAQLRVEHQDQAASHDNGRHDGRHIVEELE